MRALIVASTVLLGLSTIGLRAEEGMWEPSQLPEIGAELQRLGLELPPEALASLTEPPMSAVVSLGGCTASFVSPRGLVVTNHHCGFGAIQYNSTPERDLIHRGFYAERLEDELPAPPDSRIWVTEEIRDVTARVRAGLDAIAPGREVTETIDRRTKEIVAECEAEPGYHCKVAPFHFGLEYRLFKQLEIRDVRLVWAPPEGIGNFGGDIDNWMWPRHTGDFTFLRAYVAPDGSAASYDPGNVPFSPPSFLTVSASGVKEGDLVLVVGYPGRTSRYRVASEAEHTYEIEYPRTVGAYEELLDLLAKLTRGDEAARLAYAPLEKGVNNYYKNRKGMLEGLRRDRVAEVRRAEEEALRGWVAGDRERQRRFGPALAQMDELLVAEHAFHDRTWWYDQALRRAQLFDAAMTLYRWSRERVEPDLEREEGFQDRDRARIEGRLRRLDRRYTRRVEEGLLAWAVRRYASAREAGPPNAFDALFGVEPGNPEVPGLEARIAELYRGTTLEDGATRLAWLDREPAAFERSDDPLLRAAVAIYDFDLALEEEEDELDGRIDQARAGFMEARLAYQTVLGRPVYPDANGTLRVTYGTVAGYRPADAVRYEPFTTLEGVATKSTGEEPFHSPSELLKAIPPRPESEYRVDSLGSVPVDFLATCDITGGNSGSATLDARGRLVGLAFDGNLESVSSDWLFNEALTRSIHVDSRYVLWLMEEVYGTRRLLEEMRVVD